jgi:hypothetical protein
MPKLADFEGDHADLAERFLVLGVHESGPKSVEEVRREAASQIAQAAAAGLEGGPLPRVVLDAERGMFLDYDPKGLGDMVLVDPTGHVAAVGDGALAHLKQEMKDLRQALAAAGTALDGATDGATTATAVGALLDLGLDAAEAKAASHAETCPVPLAGAVYEALARRGRAGAVARALEGKDAKRRKAALAVMAKTPSPEWAAPLLAFARQKGTGTEDACAAMRAAFDAAPRHADMEAVLVEMSKRPTTPVRACALELLGRLGTPGAVERLLFVLAKDVSASARSGAATALATAGGDEVRAALEAAASGDKVEIVRAAARKALDARAARTRTVGG